MSLSKEAIAAYADGELDGEALREAEEAIAVDPELQAQVDAHRALRARLSAHFAPLVDRPVPDRFTALLSEIEVENKVVEFAAAAHRRAKQSEPGLRWQSFAGPALAASLVLALVGIGLSQRSSAGYAEGQVAAALNRQLVETQSPQAPVRILVSFRDGEGHFCRGFSSAAQSGIACHDGNGWELRKLVGGKKAEVGEYRQAGNDDLEILTVIQDMADGPALDAQSEEAAKRAGWRR